VALVKISHRPFSASSRRGAGRVRAAVNVTVQAAETSVETFTDDCFPLLLRTASEVSAGWVPWQPWL